MHPANQRPRKPDKLSQGAHNQTSYPKIQWENTLDKRGVQNPRERRGILRDEVIGECKVKEQEQVHMTTHGAGS